VSERANEGSSFCNSAFNSFTALPNLA
jgi:hypothetical protein